MTKKTILTGAIYQESHSFNPVVNTREYFDIDEGPSAIDGARGSNSVLGGIIDAAEKAGVAIAMTVNYRAQSAGPVDHALYLEAKEKILARARVQDYDAIVLAMHGAMITTELDDPEGDLMHALRQIVGKDIPITIGLDLHGHVSPWTLEQCDYLTGFKTNPHSDMALTGVRAFEKAMEILAGTFRPARASVHFPMLTLGNDRTDEEPLQGLLAYADSLRAKFPSLVDTSIFTVQQFLDIKGMGQTVIAYTNGDVDAAAKVADDLAERLWAARDELIGTYPTLDECLTAASAEGRTKPMILGDQGDRVAAGSPGDSTYILTALKETYPQLKAAVPIRDAEAVRQLLGKKVGDKVEVTVGGTYSKHTPPVPLVGELLRSGDDAVVKIQGPNNGGATVHMGPHAVVQSGNVMVILTARPLTFLDPNYYRGMGIAVEDIGVLVARSGYHFTLNFASTGDCVTVGTPGLSSYFPEQLGFTVARPFYPLDKIGYTPTKTTWERAV